MEFVLLAIVSTALSATPMPTPVPLALLGTTHSILAVLPHVLTTIMATIPLNLVKVAPPIVSSALNPQIVYFAFRDMCLSMELDAKMLV